jgi:hypothetical protein
VCALSTDSCKKYNIEPQIRQKSRQNVLIVTLLVHLQHNLTNSMRRPCRPERAPFTPLVIPERAQLPESFRASAASRGIPQLPFL